MIILRNNKNASPLEKKLDGQKILDYEIVPEIPKDSISVTKDLKNFKVYFPNDLEYNQYDVSDVIRLAQPGTRTSTEQEYDIVSMSVTKPLTESTFYKVLKKIIDNEGFVSIIDEDL